MEFSFLQVFILLNVFLMGILATIAWRHAYAHFRPHDDGDKHQAQHPKGVRLPPEVKERMLQESQKQFQDTLDKAAAELERDLKDTSEQLNKEFEKLKSDITNSEAERYKTMLEELRKHAETAISESKTEMAEHQTAIKAKMDEEVAAEKQRLIEQIDTKLADAMASFLTESMGHNVDLGAQSPYLVKLLEEHKDDFKRRVADEETPASAAK